MHETPEISQIILNVLIQIINLVIFFLLFRYLFASKISSALFKRKEMIKKLKDADSEYESIMIHAQEEKNRIIQEALTHKKAILDEAKETGERLQVKIIDGANKKAEDIIISANQQAQEIKNSLEQTWESSIKSTVKVVVKKLFDEDVNLQEKYVDSLINNLKK